MPVFEKQREGMDDWRAVRNGCSAEVASFALTATKIEVV
jgi:hypothetical protein